MICGHQRRECLAGLDLSRVELASPRLVELGRAGRRFVSTELCRDGRPAAAICPPRMRRGQRRTTDPACHAASAPDGPGASAACDVIVKRRE
ncbi:MAG: hypothetical protein ACYS9X_24530, partial [Planctomycetota bacterium]